MKVVILVFGCLLPSLFAEDPDTLRASYQALKEGKCLTSRNGYYTACLKEDGRFVINDITSKKETKEIWGTKPAPKGCKKPYDVNMKYDNILTLTCFKDGKVGYEYWATGTSKTAYPDKRQPILK